MARRFKPVNSVMDTVCTAQKVKTIDAILGNLDEQSVSSSRAAFAEVPLESITPRSVNRYGQVNIERLARSIRNTNNRLIHPIVLVRASDLPPDSKILSGFDDKGIDRESLKYIIVSGERRYRAFCLLRDEWDKAHEGSSFATESNPYLKITANILTRVEAEKEEVIYSDSNLETRQLTPLEGILHIRDALSEVDTLEKKRQALIDMNGGSDEGIPQDLARIDRLFNEERFCEFYFESELKITDWSKSKIKRYHAISKKCIDGIIQAVLDQKMVADHAFLIRKESPERQQELLELLNSDPKAFEDVIREMKKKNAKSEQEGKVLKYSAKSAYKKIEDIRGMLLAESVALKEISESIGGDAKKDALGVIKKIEKLMEELDAVKRQPSG